MNEDIVDAVTGTEGASEGDVSGRAARRARKACVSAGVLFGAVYAVVTVYSVEVPVAVEAVFLAAAVTGFVAAVAIGRIDVTAPRF